MKKSGDIIKAGSKGPKQLTKPKRRIGFMKGAYVPPDDIKSPFASEIEDLFYGGNKSMSGDDPNSRCRRKLIARR